MTRTMKAAFVAVAVMGTSWAALSPAQADIHLSFNPDHVAFAYSDGYWDRDHHWHAWRNRDEAKWYREHHQEHYVAQKHSHDHDKGWHESDRYWDHH